MDSMVQTLASCPDAERALGRFFLQRGTPRDLGMIRTFLKACENLHRYGVQDDSFPWIVSFSKYEKQAKSVQDLLENSLDQDPLPFSASEGGYIRLGYCPLLDEQKSLRDNGYTEIQFLQKKYVLESSISNLKIRYNQIMGHYIEVTPSQKDKVPSSFIHRQTLAGSLRFTTPELSDLALAIENSSNVIEQREKELFDEIIQKVIEQQSSLSGLFAIVADIDCSLSLASLAREKSYARPVLIEEPYLELIQARHPVVENYVRDFVPNNCTFDESSQFYVVTGPNMAGKSTYLRQTALIVWMAQMGSYVPASHARIGIVDRLFSRIGASDDLSQGRSTFMMEMIETSTILHQATERSLVILDEVGRGTSTYDGLSIAWAVCEHLYEVNQSRVLFATHYHELVRLIDKYPKLHGLTIDVQEWKDSIVFLHKIKSGYTNKSYGIHVAALAGFPKKTLQRAEEILQSLEDKHLFNIV
jgi:DNA mismatch repair protein MutS